ncbi:pseudouridine synthase [Maridesulfovibrio hydrothermalis]|uniref:Pseudouridine synthase n=1 Tax=Maridesulfovibrio hydrothermalis AM13 = DSM 14728 TaxID=1121451 RepID=L0RGE2_9BACT|nr:pseudouridine synthase [Maridesulfovibrio hydrothermalis]CCO24636.1 RNA-binding S4 domain protein [Maridesulfovibrio hydrothermalis AM13 = DSM 14728]
MTEKKTIRLNKFIASAGLTSRRGADDLVKQGKVNINGETADSPGIQVDPEIDQVEVNGKLIEYDSQAENVYVLLHKTIETVTTAYDPEGRKTVLDLLPAEIVKKRVFPVGRLDFYSEGLLMLTTDGELCNRMTHPKWHLPKIYQLTIRGKLTERQISIMESGMCLEDGELLAPVKVKTLSEIGDTSKYELILHQGINRQIRRMFSDFKKTILRLKRVRQGRLELGDLKPGKWRELTAKEITLLKNDLKMK